MQMFVQTEDPRYVVAVQIGDGRVSAPMPGGGRYAAPRGEKGLRYVMNNAVRMKREHLFPGQTVVSFEEAAKQ